MKETDVIKGLKLCKDKSIKNCAKCPYDEVGCAEKLLSDALDLIKAKNKLICEKCIEVGIEFGHDDICEGCVIRKEQDNGN